MKEQKFYLLLMVSAYTATLIFGLYYYFIGAEIIAFSCVVALGLFVLFGLFSFFKKHLITLFRVTILTAWVIFCVQIFYTGGIASSAVMELVIIPLLAYFYRPVTDRYYFLAVSGVSVVIIWMLTKQGYTQNLIPTDSETTHGLMTTVFVFSIIALFVYLFRKALISKNKLLGESMSELKDTTQKLVQSEKMASLGVLSAGVAHEINNPLNFIKGGIKALSAELTANGVKTKNSEKFINVVQQGVDRASVIVNSLSHFSRTTEQMNEQCDIHDVLDNCLVMLDHRLKHKVDVQKEYAEQKIVMVGNEGKLHQAFINIISNAEHAIIEERGEIVIKTEETKNGIKVRISDNGQGIKKEDLVKIQEPFFTTKPMGKGTGLGLSITYKIIEEHGGNINVFSEIGKGTMFEIVFLKK
jgi:signal transduction histidine kinase